jgi:hypothetical protein
MKDRLSPLSRGVHDKRDYPDSEEDEEEEFRDFNRRARDRRETKQCGDKREYEEDDGPA